MAEWNDTGRLRPAASADRPRKISSLTACNKSDAKVSIGDLTAPYVTSPFQGMTVRAVNAASRQDLLRLPDPGLRIWPIVRSQSHEAHEFWP